MHSLLHVAKLDTYAMGTFDRVYICICGRISVVMIEVYAAASLNKGDFTLQIIDR